MKWRRNEGLIAREGFKSDDYECAIEFLSNFYDNIFDEEEINFMQQMRQIRNKSRYEGKNVEISVAEDYISRTKLSFNKLIGQLWSAAKLRSYLVDSFFYNLLRY